MDDQIRTADEQVVDTDEALRALYDDPTERVLQKQQNKLDRYSRQFIALSPYVCLATSDADGQLDVSPRGDAPGFVQIVDDETLMIPDRRGNNRLDSLGNVVANPTVGLLFLVPGFRETLRVNGVGRIVRDPTRLDSMAVNGKAPTVALEVTVRETFFHCGKAAIRAKLWDPAAQVDRKKMPGLGQIVAEQIAGKPISQDEVLEADRWIEDGYKTRLY